MLMYVRDGPYIQVKIDINLRLVSFEKIWVTRDHLGLDVNSQVFHFVLPLCYPGGLRDIYSSCDQLGVWNS